MGLAVLVSSAVDAVFGSSDMTFIQDWSLPSGQATHFQQTLNKGNSFPILQTPWKNSMGFAHWD